MKILKEVTDWAWPNHTYFTNDNKDKAYGYVKHSTGEFEQFKQPMPFSTSKRKFKEVLNQWGFKEPQGAKPEGKSWTIIGSKGDSYTVSELNGEFSCTCSGFRFRGNCKHTTAVLED